MFAATTQVSFLAIAQYFLPVLGKLPSERKRTTKKSMEVLSRVGAVRPDLSLAPLPARDPC